MITSTGNARVKQLVTWQKKRKARDEEGIYIVEGSGCTGSSACAGERGLCIGAVLQPIWRRTGTFGMGKTDGNPVRSCIFPRVRYKDTTGDPACDGAEKL